MTDALARLKTALSDRYTIEHELGAGGTPGASHCSHGGLDFPLTE